MKVEVNTNKNKVYTFGSTVQRPFNAFISGITVREYKYLGIWLSNKGHMLWHRIMWLNSVREAQLPYKGSIRCHQSLL